MNIKNLRDELIEVFEGLKAGSVKTKDAKELINCSGKIILTSKIELDYNKFMNLKRTVDFLDVKEEVIEVKAE